MLAATMNAFRSSRERARAFRRLSELDDHMLKDLGIARSDIRSMVYNPATERNPRR